VYYKANTTKSRKEKTIKEKTSKERMEMIIRLVNDAKG
jgi:hypothetical protein